MNFGKTRRRKWVLCGAIVAALIIAVMFIPDFLTVSDPVGGGVLVVEAWIPSSTLAHSVGVFDSGRYRDLVVVGGPIGATEGRSSPPRTYDERAAKTLEKLGFDDTKLVKISVPPVSAGRTLAEAMAVKQWLRASGTSLCCVDVFTEGVHSRKSWIVYRYALGGHYQVGIIAGTPGSYNPKFWFLSTHGLYIVLRNVAGYLYTRYWLLFGGKIPP